MSVRGLTAKQEAFAQAYVELGCASDALRKAYPTSQTWKSGGLWVRASRLLAHPKIAVRIKELQDAARERTHVVTLDKLTRMAFEAYEIARQENTAAAASAMTRVVAQLSKMHGYDAAERPNDHEPVGPLTPYTIDELGERLEALRAKSRQKVTS